MTSVSTELINKKASLVKYIILNSLERQGFFIDDAKEIKILRSSNNKEIIRSLHSSFKNDKLIRNVSFLRNNFDALKKHIANGADIVTNDFAPVMIPVEKEEEYSRLFRFASLLWSIPVSEGFGRRTRFLVIDSANDKLVGIFALGDPVFNLSPRDKHIGWTHKQRSKRLYHVMDVFVLGAIPPYSNLLCGKLIAMLAASNEVRTLIYNKYKDTRSVILGEKREPNLVFLTTSSALGKSSLYNRIKFHNELLYRRIGETEGWGHFHVSDNTLSEMKELLIMMQHPIVKRNRFGQGPNWKMRLIRTCLQKIDLSPRILRHGIRREVYGVSLAENYRTFLLGLEDQIKSYDFPASTMISFFKERWFFPRSRRNESYKIIKADETLSNLYYYSRQPLGENQ